MRKEMKNMKRKSWTAEMDDMDDKMHGVKEGSKKDKALDKKRGVPEEKKAKKKTYKGKSLKLGQGGRAAKLKTKLTAKGLPASEVGGIIGNIARSKFAAPGQKNFH